MLRVEIWIATTIFSVGIIAGMTYLNVTSDAPGSNGEIAVINNDVSGLLEHWDTGTAELKPAMTEKDSDSRKSALRQGDRFFLAGNYGIALEHYADYKRNVVAGGTAVALREAMCLEKQKQFTLAQQRYLLVTSEATNPNHQLLGISGFARCLLLDGKKNEAIEILAHQALKIDLLVDAPIEIRAQLIFQFAKALESQAVDTNPDLTKSHSVAFESFSPNLEAFVDVIDREVEVKTPTTRGDSPFSIEVLQRPSNSAKVIMANVSVSLEPILTSVTQIAAAAQWELLISQNAQSTIASRSKTIEMHSSPLSSVLDRLLIPMGLSWYQEKSVLHIVTRRELKDRFPSRDPWADLAIRAFRRFELVFPDDDRRAIALLSRANLHFIQKEYDDAFNRYQELMQSKPQEEILAKMFFNLAKLQALLGRPAESSRFLYLAIDQTSDPNIESSSYCILGANHLTEGKVKTAIKISRRGLAIAVTVQQRQTASLMLTRAYLLDNNPYSANRSLFRDHESYLDPKTQAAAAILGSYARFLGTTGKRGRETAQHRLLTALAMMPDIDYLSFADCYLSGQAFERIGFRNLAIEKMLLALTHSDVGVWRRQIMFELGVLQKRNRQPDSARATFEALIQTDDAWKTMALEQLARIYLDSDQTDLCIETCRQLWQADLTEVQKRTALQLLGFAFQKKGKHHSAAFCFAGMLPDSF